MSPPPAKPPASIFSTMKPPSSSTPPPPLYTLLFFLLLVILGFYALHRQTTTSTSTAADSKSLCFAEKFLSFSTNETISTYLRHLTSHQHLAGTLPSDETADYVYTHFKTLGLNPQIVPYRVLLSYPISSSLAVHFRNGTSAAVKITDENGVVVMPYHAYSPSGSAVAEPVYVNHGSEEDYRALHALGVSVKGRVVLVRKGGGGGLSRGAAVRIAARQGAAATVLFGGGKGVERGTVMNGLGDPLSSGWAAVEGGERLEEKQVSEEKFPKIPSIPISSQAADVILGSLGGPAVPTEWGIGFDSRPGQRVGPGPALVNLTFLGEKKEARIQNVFAVIRGFEEPDRYVIMGNHRDAWTYGAVDPNSGTAALLDIARRFSNMLRNGWRPRRTIVLSSWDGEEFGMGLRNGLSRIW
ncbi:Probable glutamate carboxypeptidase AMP1 [Linum grandiflorum]